MRFVVLVNPGPRVQHEKSIQVTANAHLRVELAIDENYRLLSSGVILQGSEDSTYDPQNHSRDEPPPIIRLKAANGNMSTSAIAPLPNKHYERTEYQDSPMTSPIAKP